MAKQSRAEEIHQYIRDQMLLGRWEPGDRLNDLELAEEMQVSRLSVREALFRLIETGIVEKSQWKGYYIKEISNIDISNLIELRIVLETTSLRNFVMDAKEEDFKDMKKTIDESEELLNKKDLLHYLTHDYHFHEIGYTRQHNNYIRMTLDNFFIAIQFIRYISMGRDGDFFKTAKNSIQDHREILKALRERNEEKAIQLLIKHLSKHKEKTIAELTSHIH